MTFKYVCTTCNLIEKLGSSGKYVTLVDWSVKYLSQKLIKDLLVTEFRKAMAMDVFHAKTVCQLSQ